MSQSILPRERQGLDYAGEQNVQELHAAIQPAKADGRVIIKPFSLWMLVVCGLVFFLAGFFSSRQGTNLDRGNPAAATSTSQAVQTDALPANAVHGTVAEANAPAVLQVTMRNMKFNPPTLEVKKGDTIEWKNDDMTPHTATSTNFDSGPIASDASWRHTFTEAGIFAYTCTFHPEMKAAVVVK